MENPNAIPWSKKHFLGWPDFQAEFNPASFEDAHSTIKYRCTWTVGSESFGREIRFFIEKLELHPEFHKHLSWVRTPMASPLLLNHEQGHFDLAELLRPMITTKMQRVFDGKTYPARGQNEEQRKQSSREDSAAMINKELERWEKHLEQMRSDYDKETEFGQNPAKQCEYDAKFKLLRN